MVEGGSTEEREARANVRTHSGLMGYVLLSLEWIDSGFIQAHAQNEFGGHFFCPVHTRFSGGGQVGQWLFPARDEALQPI